MRTSSLLGCGAISMAAVLGCGGTSGTGGAGGTGSTTASSTNAKASSSSKATTTTVASASGSGTGGAMGVQCNPVKDTECDVAGGEGCDYDQTAGFVCYLGPDNTIDVCGACNYDPGNPPFCKDGTTCMPDDAAMMTGKCVRFCCTDSDCGGAVGSCDKTLSGDPNVGLCGAEDATSMFIPAPICTAPAAPPTGSCYTVPP